MYLVSVVLIGLVVVGLVGGLFCTDVCFCFFDYCFGLTLVFVGYVRWI